MSATVCRVTERDIDPDSEVAPYLQLAGILRDQIRSGALAGGTKLPSIIDLAEQFSVARVTAHKALRVLVDEGLAVVSKGRGTYVRRQAPAPQVQPVNGGKA
jgi:GntR family transcriptional regulator